jgi:translation initiation factor 5A
MSDVDESQFAIESNAGSGASLSYPIQCSALRKGGHVLLNDRPCRIVDMSTSKTGKHGHAKVALTGIDIFNGRKYEDACPSTHNMNVPNISRKEFTLVDIGDDKFLTLMNDSGATKLDVKLPEEELGPQIASAFADGKELYVTVVGAMNEEAVISFRESNK